MRFLSYLTTLLIAVLLAACGGGGGSSGSNPNRPTLFSTAPASLTLPIGAVREFSVRGGVAPYSIQNSDSRVVAGFVRGEVLTLNSVGQGKANVTVLDNNGSTLTISVTVGTELKLSMSTIQSFVGDVVKATITGGTPPYRTSTIDIAVSAVVNGDQLIMTLNAVSSTVDVVVLDANDQQAKLTVTVINGSPQIRMSPGAVTVSESDTRPLAFTIFGAAPGLINVRSSDPTLLQASVSGNTVTVVTGSNGDRCVAANTPVTIEVNDSRGAFATAVVTIANSAGGCSDLTIPSGDFLVQAGTTRSVVIGGDAQTGYSVSSDNESLATAKYAGGVLSVTGVLPAPVCPAATTPPTVPTPPCVPFTGPDQTVNITVTDIAHPKRFITLRVTVRYPS